MSWTEICFKFAGTLFHSETVWRILAHGRSRAADQKEGQFERFDLKRQQQDFAGKFLSGGRPPDGRNGGRRRYCC